MQFLICRVLIMACVRSFHIKPLACCGCEELVDSSKKNTYKFLVKDIEVSFTQGAVVVVVIIYFVWSFSHGKGILNVHYNNPLPRQLHYFVWLLALRVIIHTHVASLNEL
jgi:hypothetical protein